MITLNEVHSAIADYFGMTRFGIFEEMDKQHSYARHLFHFLSYRMTPYSNEVISDYSNRSPASVWNSRKVIEGFLTYDSKVERDVEEIKNRLIKH